MMLTSTATARQHVTSLEIAHTFAYCHRKYSQICSVLCFDRKGLRCWGLRVTLW